ncbi:MAG: ECF transporter S component [Bacilli bacterium]|nr:ECF transporter S component [Bacilli bacterium]
MVKGIVFGIAFILWFVSLLLVYSNLKIKSKNHKNWTKFIVRIGIFGSIATILYVVPLLQFKIPFFPSFLEFHFDEIPVFIAGFAYGPLTALGILFVKTIIKLPFTSTVCVGELADFIYSAVFILPASLIYKKRRTFKFALLGILIGTVCQMAVSVTVNVYLMIPFYVKMYGMTEETLLAICQLANPKIKDAKWSLGLIGILPFNAIKDFIVVVLTLLVYKSTRKLINKVHE